MKRINLKKISKEKLIEHITESKANPSNFLKEAIDYNRFDLVKTLMEYGANLTQLGDGLERESYLDSLPEELSSYLFSYALLPHTGQSNLEQVCSQVSAYLYWTDIMNNTSRSTYFENQNKVCHWSFGLLTREAKDPSFLSILNSIADVTDWDDRFTNSIPTSQSGFYLLTAISHDGYYEESEMTPNISARFHIYLVAGYNLYRFLGQLTFNGFTTILGIAHLEDSPIFKENGEVDISIFPRLENALSYIKSEDAYGINFDQEPIEDGSYSSDDFSTYIPQDGDIYMKGIFYENIHNENLREYREKLIDEKEWLKRSIKTSMPIDCFREDSFEIFGPGWKDKTRSIVEKDFPEMMIRYKIMSESSIVKSKESNVIKKSLYTFKDLSLWDQELNHASNSFKSHFGSFPNIMQASEVTYRKIELVANSKPQKIKGDGSDGMPVIPSHFVELAGFQGEGYSLEMCIDEELKELEFSLIYNSDPDGEFYVEPEDLEKAV